MNAAFRKHIVACQRGGVANKPPWLQAVTSLQLSACTECDTYIKYLDRANLVINNQKFKKADQPLDPFY